MKILWATLIGLLMVAELHCQSSQPNVKLANAINNFSLNLYKKLTETKKDNLICSGYSAHAVLNLLLAGSRGSTAQQISDTLGYKNFSITEAELPTSYRQLLDVLKTNNTGYELDVANSAWIQSGFDVNPDFITHVQNNFNVEQRRVDFQSSLATNQINQWVSEKTKGRIPKLFDEPLDPSTALVLANAIYFKGKWLDEFNKNLSRQEEFFSGSGSKNVVMMKKTTSASFKDSHELDAQILELPYNGSDVSMVIVLPKSQNGLEALERKLSIGNLSNVLEDLEREIVHITIPKFSITSKIPLKSVLQSLGIVQAFSSAANLSGISSHANLYVSDAIQKADIEVTEEGTVAAAATGIVIVPYSLIIPNEVTFRANHPFFYLIRHKTTGIILFCGRVNNP